jgi:tripartite-type tricarboxylate transporter receptor subunit TctC
MTEAGDRLEADAWFGIFLPAGTPSAMTQRLNQEVIRIVRMPETVERFTVLKMRDSRIKTVEQFAQTTKTANIKTE